MADITLRSNKGSPLTNAEVDSNFSNLNTELGQKEVASNKGAAGGYASLDAGGKVPASQLPSYVDDVVEAANFLSLPGTGETGKIYVTIDTNKTYRWSGSAYVEISASPGSTDAVTEGSTNLYFTNARARSAISATGSLSYNSSTGVMSFTDAVTSVAGKTGAVTLTNSDVGLGNVENKSSATIRGELTSSNVTTALGFTPLSTSGKAADAETVDGIDSSRIVYGGTGAASNQLATTQNVYELGQYKSGFWDVTGASWTPTTDWFWGATFAHGSNSSSYNYSGQLAFINGGGGDFLYARTISNGNPSAWSRLLSSGNFNAYAPTLTGTGASGTWGISITGNTSGATLPQYYGSAFNWNGVAVQHYWTRIANVSGNDGWAMVLVTTKQDVNYVPSGAYLLSISRFNGSSFSVKVDALNSHDTNLLVRIDNNGGVWIKANVEWNSQKAWRVIASLGENVMYGSFNSETLSTPADSIELSPGQQVRGTQGAATSASVSTNTNRLGAITALGSITTTSNGNQLQFQRSDGTTPNWTFHGWSGGLNIFSSAVSTLYIGRDGPGTNLDVYNGSLTQAGNQVLHAGNYTSYSPSLAGSGASGTWGISVTGTSRGVGTSDPALGTGGLWVTTGTGLNVARNSTSYVVLDAGNYTSYSPSLTGSGASGTWSINVTGSSASTTGNAATASRVVYQGNRTAETGSTVSTPSDRIDFVGAYANGYPATYGNVMSIRGGGVSQLYLGWNGGSSAATGDLYYRSMTDWMDGWGSWRRVLNDSNYSSYALPLAGGTLTGELHVNTGAVGQLRLTAPGGTQSLWIRSGYDADGTPTPVSSPTNVTFQSSGNSSGTFSFVAGNTKVLSIGGVNNSLVALQQNGNQVLHAGNSSDYQSRSIKAVRTANVNFNSLNTAVDTFTAGTNYIPNGGAYNQPADGDHHYLSWGGIEGQNVWGAQIDINFYDDRMWFRRQNGADWQAWRNVLHDGNYGSYALPLSGGAVTGTVTFGSFLRIASDNSDWGTGNYFRGQSNHFVLGVQSGGTLYLNYGNSAGTTRIEGTTLINGNTALHAANYNSYSPTLTGTGASGTWSINVTGNAATATSADQIDGWGFVNTGSNAGVNADTIDSNGISYYTAGVTNFSGNATDGALYSQRYSSSWQHQIAADYRSGQIALRGKNNGTWQSWRTVLDSSNFTSYAPQIVYGDSGSHNLDTVGSAAHGQIRFSTGVWGGTNPYPGNYSHVLSFNASTANSNRTVQLYMGDLPGHIYWRMNQAGTQHPWERILTSNNYNSWAPSLTGSGASGTWAINVTGTSANTSGYSTYLPTRYDGGQQLNPQTYFGQGIGLRVAMTAAAGYWSDTMWINGYAGGDVLSMCALHTSRQGTPRMWISTQTSTGTSYGTLYEFLSTYNYNSYSPTLTGGGASGTWGISITGNAATVGSRGVGNSYGNIAYFDGSGNLFVNNPESYSGEVRLGAAWGRGGVYGSNGVTVSTGGSFIDHVHNNNVSMRHVYDANGSRVIIGSGQTSTPYTLVDGNARPTLYMRGQYPVLVLDHTATSNGSHGPTIQFAHDGVGARQWVVGTNGTGTRIDFGYADSGTGNTNYNPHNGISGYAGTTWMTVRNNGRIGFGWEGDWGDYGTNGEPLYPFHFIGSHQNSHTYLFRNASNASNGCGAIFVNTHGNHSWGICSEFRVDGSSGSDRPSILFSSGYNSDTWSVGFGSGSDSNFRINRDHGHRNGSWGTTLMVMDRSGNVTFSGNVTAYSDRRLKTDIKRIENAGDIVRRLEGVSFKYREDGRDGIGLIAQDVELVLPQIVGEATSSDGSTHKNVAYGNVVAVLIEAIKELQDEVASLKSTLH